MQIKENLSGSVHHIWDQDLGNREAIHNNLAMGAILECRLREVGLRGIILEDDPKVRAI